MDKKVITEKIKEILTEEDFQIFEGAVEKMIDDKVSLKEEEIKKKYDELAEKYVVEEVEKRVTDYKAKLVEDYDAKLDTLEKKIVAKLDAFFEHVIAEQISDEMIEKIAINEALSPVVEGIKKVYSENFIELNSDASKKIEESTSKISQLEKQLSEAISKQMLAEERLEKTATYLLISEKTEGMTASEKERVVKMFKDKHFNEVKEKIGTFVEIIKESSKPKVTTETKKTEVTSKKVIKESTTVEDKIEVEKPKVVEEKVDEVTTVSKANRYM